MSDRAITTDDIWAATRGLQLFSMDRDELRQTFLAHRGKDVFASRVIAEAAWQVMMARCTSNAEARLPAKASGSCHIGCPCRLRP